MGFENYEKVYLNFIKKLVGVKHNTKTSMLYAEIRQEIRKTLILVEDNEQHNLPRIAYNNMFIRSVENWTTKIKLILFENEYG